VKDGKFKIGEVVEILRKEYPDISASTLRYWEKEKLIAPSKKTAGGQRLYTDEDLNLIRFLKEMSLSGFSIAKMRQEVSRAKVAISKSKRGEISYAFYESKDFSQRIKIQRRSNLVNAKRKIYYTTLPKMRYKPLYTREALKEMLDFDRAEELIERADQFHLTRPVKDKNGQYLYSLTDELILQIIILVTLHEKYLRGESHFLEKIKNLDRVVRYLAGEVGIFVGFPDDPQSTAHMTIYSALLFNLIQQRQDYFGEWKKSAKKNKEVSS